MHLCRETLCDSDVVSFIDESALVWAASVTKSDGCAVGAALGAATFPFFALLVCMSNGVNVVDKVQGEYAIFS